MKKKIRRAKINIDSVFAVSKNVVSRKIIDEFVLIPIAGGIGEGRVLTLCETGKTIWSKFNGKKSLKDIIRELNKIFRGTIKEIEEDVLDFSGELLRLNLLVKVNKK
jgi:hypothetical protein